MVYKKIDIMVTRKKSRKDCNKLTLQDYVQKFNELSTVFASMPIGVCAILDQKSNIATMNKTAGEILDSDADSLIGKNAREVFETRFPGIQKLISETIESRRPIRNFNLNIEDRNGEVKTYLVSTAITEELGTGSVE
jgi:PAS domain S-box-containing protein